jgi:hypothetical protein
MVQPNIDGDVGGIGIGSNRASDAGTNTDTVLRAVDTRIRSLRMEGSAGDALRENGLSISERLTHARNVFQGKADALTLTQQNYVGADAESRALFTRVNPTTTIST